MPAGVEILFVGVFLLITFLFAPTVSKRKVAKVFGFLQVDSFFLRGIVKKIFFS